MVFCVGVRGLWGFRDLARPFFEPRVHGSGAWGDDDPSISASQRQPACHGHPEREGSRVSPGHPGRMHVSALQKLEGSGPRQMKIVLKRHPESPSDTQAFQPPAIENVTRAPCDT